MTVLPAVPARVRATSTLTLTATVCHDGDRDALAGHLAVEAGTALRRWGVDVLGLDSTAERVHDGDPPSGELPAIGCPHPPDDFQVDP